MSRSLPLLLASLLAVACGGAKEEPKSPMTGHVETLEHTLKHFTGEVQNHKASVDAATATAELTALESGHMAKADEAIAELMETSELMHSCTNSGGKTPDVEHMHALADQMKQECHNHEAAMAGVTDLAAAKAEETRHHDRMADLSAQARAIPTELAPVADGYLCTSAPHGTGH